MKIHSALEGMSFGLQDECVRKKEKKKLFSNSFIASSLFASQDVHCIYMNNNIYFYYTEMHNAWAWHKTYILDQQIL